MSLKSILATLGLVTIDLKPGQVFDHHQVTLFKDGVAGEPVNTTDGSVTFTDLEPGTYRVEGVSVDADGQPMTDVVVSGELVVEAPEPGHAQVIGSITVSFAPAEEPAP